MCGIFGAIRTSGYFEASASQEFLQLTDLVQHRGPNDSGHVALRVKNPPFVMNGLFDVFLGSRRLSVIDLSADGHQPMSDHNGRWITYNGEIFNYVELRDELKAKNHRFRTATDTEVILHVYDEYGEAGFEKLNGMWAFALADVPGQRVILSRDRFSIKPLYLLRLNDTIFFSSEIKQLLPLLPHKRLNLSVMVDFLQQGLLDHSPETFFEGITRVAPKTNVIICLRTGRISEQKYWDFAQPRTHFNGAPEEAFRSLFLDSVKIRLRSDVPVGVLLSGGLDSSAIAVAAGLVSDTPVETYSAVSCDEKYSEQKFIDILAARGLKNQRIVLRSSDVKQDLQRALYHSDEPFGGVSVLAQYKLLEMIRQSTSTTVLLSGQGGDEVLLGYLKFFFFYVRRLFDQHQYTRALAQLLKSLVRGTAVAQLNLGQARRYMPALSWRKARMLKVAREAVPIWVCKDLRARQVADIDFYSVPALTHYEDRNSGAHSLEVRHPFLDHRLVDLLINLPVEEKIQNGWTKYILRRSLPELPKAIRWRRDKQSFLTPEVSWLKRDLREMIVDLFSKSRLGEMEIIDDQAFLDRYELFRSGASIPHTEISRVLIAETWMRNHFN
jgi:asparagine synthase (glutamine-hydrolysing)